MQRSKLHLSLEEIKIHYIRRIEHTPYILDTLKATN